MNTAPEQSPGETARERVRAFVALVEESGSGAVWHYGHALDIGDLRLLLATTSAPVGDVGGLVAGALKQARQPTHYPDYLDDPEGFERLREAANTQDGHAFTACNNNSVWRLVETIERLQRALAILAALSPSLIQPQGAAGAFERARHVATMLHTNARVLRGEKGVKAWSGDFVELEYQAIMEEPNRALIQQGEALRRALDGLGYQVVFNAIGDAVEWKPDRALGISVEKLIFALTGIPRQPQGEDRS